MKLYLIRHAQATEKQASPKRPLTRRGRADAEQLGRRLRSLGVALPTIWHSRKCRAIETAECLIAGFAPRQSGRPRSTPHAGLKPMSDVKRIAGELESRTKDLAIVGHEPFLGRLASYLLVGKSTSVRLELDKPSAVCIQRTSDEDNGGPAGGWKLLWMLSGEAMKSC